ncbi:response regulator [Sphingomonas sp. CFBP 13720]|uniref:response regulator n=1 Tax=Sphingomonas sp. CFBP 13720 TaxID=2775302 RepID=UPI00177AC14B|nr:response regulator [Sphingomonas sp. CFBP 13720]MBD8678349.1 response regulator [Sphingomonas sp. CFBP 13720]
MSERQLEGCRILVVEDEYLIADDLRLALIDAGADVLGPVPTVTAAQSVLAAESRIDAALLDINLGGTMVFDLADALEARSVPFVFATGYDESAIPERFSAVPRLEKPVKARNVLATLGPLLNRQPSM